MFTATMVTLEDTIAELNLIQPVEYIKWKDLPDGSYKLMNIQSGFHNDGSGHRFRSVLATILREDDRKQHVFLSSTHSSATTDEKISILISGIGRLMLVKSNITLTWQLL